jgi:hypothetical protein
LSTAGQKRRVFERAQSSNKYAKDCPMQAYSRTEPVIMHQRGHDSHFARQGRKKGALAKTA